MAGEQSGAAAARSQARTAWMARAQAGDRDAYRALLDDVVPALEAFLRRRVPDAADADDVLQETLVNLHRARHTYDPARPFEPWLLAIARNAAADHARRRAARLAREVAVDELPERPVPADTGVGSRLAQALEALPAAQREAFELLELDGLPVHAAAARVGITPGALKVRAHRAYRFLRARLLGS